MRPLLSLAASILLCAAAAAQAAPAPKPGTPTFAREGWRAAIKANDAERLARLDEAWSLGLSRARAAGFATELTRLGLVAEPKAGLADLSLRDGRYRCRIIKIGAQFPGLLDFNPSPMFDCAVAAAPGGGRSFTKLTGSQRPTGRLYPDGDGRLVFLGALGLGSDRTTPAYGAIDERDAAGVLERVGPRKWRLVIPFPRAESVIDVIELTPR